MYMQSRLPANFGFDQWIVASSGQGLLVIFVVFDVYYSKISGQTKASLLVQEKLVTKLWIR